MTEILLADEDAQRRIDVQDRLVEEGYRVRLACDGRETLQQVFAESIDLVVLSAPLIDRDAASVCQELRRRGFEGPVILLIDAGRAHQRVQALRLGADDVLTRPCDLSELLARIEACLRRGPVVRPTAMLRFGEVEVDLRGARVLKAGRPVQLRPREFQLLCCLAARPGRPVSRAELLDAAWGRDASPDPQTVDVHVAGLRRKLEADPARPTLIRTVHGIGYMLAGFLRRG